MGFKKTILITGGAGFIGSHLVRRFVLNHPEYHIINLDILSYAGNLENLADVENADNYSFERGDVTDLVGLRHLFEKYHFDGVIHLAAESHVDRSIQDPLIFARVNVMGTGYLLQVAKEKWNGKMKDKVFYHVSTDEVYGSLGNNGFFVENTPYDPRSPYSASKAGSDHLVRSFYHTFNLPILISNCSNNYGPNQFPEKLIPLFINNIISEKPLPVYGKGINVRDWLYVEDHAKAIDDVFHKGTIGETYNIGGHNEWRNIDLVEELCRQMDLKLGREPGSSKKLITYVEDRKGHDHRYAIDASKIKSELGWEPTLQFEAGLSKTIDWYLENQSWLSNVTSGAYSKYYERTYKSK